LTAPLYANRNYVVTVVKHVTHFSAAIATLAEGRTGLSRIAVTA
jgi:hypothetical protein